MARIAGIDIPRERKVPFSLCYIHGIGITTANEICDKAKVDKNLRVKDLSNDQVTSVRDAISSLELKAVTLEPISTLIKASAVSISIS